MLNIGPKADGSIPQPQIDRLLELGQWLKVNGEGIYRSRCSRHLSQQHDHLTYYFTRVDQDLYLFIDGLQQGENQLPLGIYGELEALNKEVDFQVLPQQQGRMLHIHNYQPNWYILGFKIAKGEML